MAFLLDTHTLIWALSAPERLPGAVRHLIEDPNNAIFVSAASAWEIAIKTALGKLDFPLATLPKALNDCDFAELPISVAHTLQLSALPQHHRDPFDRLLIAQAIAEGMTLVSRDPLLRLYQVAVRWDS